MTWSMVEDATNVLSLDPRIRDYVLFPISIVMIMQGVLRQYVSLLMQDPPQPAKLADVRQGELLRRCRLLRSSRHLLTETAFAMRRAVLIKELDRIASELTPQETADPAQLPMQNPEDLQGMVGMMKQNMANVVPNMLSMAWVSYFFSGFVLVKLPFPLGNSFKAMLQQGISIQNLDPSYVSSLSWYFLNLFGMQGLFSLFLGADNAAGNPTAMYAQMNPAAGALRPEPQKPFMMERDEMEIVKHDAFIDDAYGRVVLGADPVQKRLHLS